MKCPRCSTDIGMEDRFCGECGFDLKTETQIIKADNQSIKTGTSLGLSENTEGALCYLFWWITGILLLLFEKESKFVQFHALQSIITFLILSIMSTFLYYFVGSFLFILYLFLWVFLMYKAYTGEKYKLPVIGDFVERYSKV